MRYYCVSLSLLTFSPLCDVFHNKYYTNICTPRFLPPSLTYHKPPRIHPFQRQQLKKSQENPQTCVVSGICLKFVLVSGIFVSDEYKKFSEITDTELVAESLFPNAKLSVLDLKILLRWVYDLYYNKWLTDDDVVFCVAFVKVGDM